MAQDAALIRVPDDLSRHEGFAEGIARKRLLALSETLRDMACGFVADRRTREVSRQEPVPIAAPNR